MAGFLIGFGIGLAIGGLVIGILSLIFHKKDGVFALMLVAFGGLAIGFGIGFGGWPIFFGWCGRFWPMVLPLFQSLPWQWTRTPMIWR